MLSTEDWSFFITIVIYLYVFYFSEPIKLVYFYLFFPSGYKANIPRAEDTPTWHSWAIQVSLLWHSCENVIAILQGTISYSTRICPIITFQISWRKYKYKFSQLHWFSSVHYVWKTAESTNTGWLYMYYIILKVHYFLGQGGKASNILIIEEEIPNSFLHRKHKWGKHWCFFPFSMNSL